MKPVVQFVGTHVPGVPLREQCVARQRVVLGRFPVVEDPERRGVWPTTREAWDVALDYATPQTTHVMIVQDDLLPCNTFVENLTAALTVARNRAVCTYTIRKQSEQAPQELRWGFSADHIGAGSVIPIEWVRPYLAWCDSAVVDGYPHDDRRLAAWLHWSGLTPVWVTIPPLFQHIGCGDSLLGHSNSSRYAKRWKVDQPLLDWSNTEGVTLNSSPGSWLNEVKDHLTPFGREWVQFKGTR